MKAKGKRKRAKREDVEGRRQKVLLAVGGVNGAVARP